MCKSELDRSQYLCPTIFFIVLVGVLAGLGALIGVLLSQSESCCLAVKACWGEQSGRIINGPCAGPLKCENIIDYADKCYVQQQPIILYYTGLGAASGVGLILLSGLFCLIGALFITSTRNEMFTWLKNCCTCCKRTNYEILP